MVVVRVAPVSVVVVVMVMVCDDVGAAFATAAAGAPPTLPLPMDTALPMVLGNHQQRWRRQDVGTEPHASADWRRTVALSP